MKVLCISTRLKLQSVKYILFTHLYVLRLPGYCLVIQESQLKKDPLQVEEMSRENAELRTASQHNSLTVTETEPVSDVKQRPVSMYETRESVRAQVRIG